jgi:hypothetical protein
VDGITILAAVAVPFETEYSVPPYIDVNNRPGVPLEGCWGLPPGSSGSPQPAMVNPTTATSAIIPNKRGEKSFLFGFMKFPFYTNIATGSNLPIYTNKCSKFAPYNLYIEQ